MVENFDESFDETNNGAISEEGAKVEGEAKKRNDISKLKQEYSKFLAESPEAGSRRNVLCNSVEISRIYGYGPNSGNIIRDKNEKVWSEKQQKEVGKLIGVSKIVGFELKNSSDKPITFLTELYTEQDGTWVGNTTTQTVNPGETIKLARKYFALNGVRPEFGEKFKNGDLVLRTKSQIEQIDLNTLLESASFKYKTELGLQVNDPSVKTQIGEEINGKWTVKPEFTETFGFLMNKKSSVRGGKVSGEKKKKAPGVTDAEAMANSIWEDLMQSAK